MTHSHLPISLAVVLTGTLALRAADWPNYRGPAYDGRSTEKLAADSWPASGPRAIWKTPTPDGFSSFTVADGRVFTIITRDMEGVERETVIALDAQTGKELWAYAMATAKYGHDGGNRGTPDNPGGDGPRSTPTIRGELVYALDSKLLLVCLETATGKEVWKRNIMAEHKGQEISWGSAASPVVEGDLIFVACGGEGQSLLGIDRNDGHTVWKGESDKYTHVTPIVTTLHGVRQVIFLTQPGLVAVRPADGTVLWRQDFPYRISTAASPVVSGDIIYCSAAYSMGAGAYRITKEGDAFKSTELWRQSGKLENHWSTPVAYEGRIYGIYGHGKFGSAPLKCIELSSGKELWSKDGFGPGNVTLVDGHLLVLGDAGQLVLVEANPAAYKEKARADVLDGKCWSTPTYASGRIYVRSTKEGACLDLNPAVAAAR